MYSARWNSKYRDLLLRAISRAVVSTRGPVTPTNRKFPGHSRFAFSRFHTILCIIKGTLEPELFARGITAIKPAIALYFGFTKLSNSYRLLTKSEQALWCLLLNRYFSWAIIETVSFYCFSLMLTTMMDLIRRIFSFMHNFSEYTISYDFAVAEFEQL